MNGVTGRVLSPGTLVPLEGAAVTLVPLADTAKQLHAYTNATGDFRIDSAPPARYLMRVRRLGFRAVRDTIEITPDSGIVATGLLALDNIVLDECSLTYQEVRVPWWKR
jgi:hypothetical protein